MDSNEWTEAILVQSQPPGAKVYNRGKFIGTTPGYLRVRRGRKPELTFRYGNESVTQKLVSKYRWADSFFSNFLFLTVAPVGWIVDLTTGTAWKMEDPVPPHFEGQPLPYSEENKVAIAPPDAGDQEIADAVGPLLRMRLDKALPQFSVINYDESLKFFRYYDTEVGLPESKENRYALFAGLQNQYVLVSKVEPHGAGLEVSAHLKNVFNGENIKDYKWEIAATEDDLKEDLSFYTRFSKYFHILPNTLMASLTSYQTTVRINDMDVGARETPPNSVGAKILHLIGALSFESHEKPRPELRSRWVFSFVPDFNLSLRSFYFPYTMFSDVRFERWYASGGYGPELGWRNSFGYLFVNFVPSVAWEQLGYSSPAQRGSASDVNVVGTVQLGFTHFFSDHLVGKIFVKSLSENTKVYDRAISQLTGMNAQFQSASSTFAGISLGYYFPTTFKGRRGFKLSDPAAH